MQHLELDELARLVDEAPTAAESAHLAQCRSCCAEWQALRQQCAELGALPDLAPALGAWAALEERLQAEGLLRDPAVIPAVFPRHRARAPREWLPPLLRVAAALALFLGGGAAGAAWQQAQGAAAAPTYVSEPLVVGGEPAVAAAAPAASLAVPPATEAVPAAPAARRQNEARLAEARVHDTEAAYLDALTRFAALDDEPAEGDALNRLAALEGIVLTTRAALEQAPADPVINGYHLAALSQRDALLRRLQPSRASSPSPNESWY